MNKPVATAAADIQVPAPAALRPKIVPPARSTFRKYALSGGLLVLLLVAGIAWWTFGTATPVTYMTVPVTRGAITRAVTATGTVNPELTIIVGSYVSGVIQEIHCDYNTEVKQGQVCARIDPRPYQTIVDQNRANHAVAKAQLEKDKANLSYTKLAFDRASRLAQSNAVSQDALDTARTAFAQAQAQITFDEATIQQRQAALDAAQVNLDYTNIVSPVNGTVVSRNVTVGQTVAASFQTPTLFLIATDLTRMQVDTNVSESDIGGIGNGNRAQFTVDAFPKRTFEGSVTQVRQSPQTVQNVVTYDVVVTVDNADLALKPGMTAATRIITDQRADVLRVPSQALRYTPTSARGTRPSGASSRTRPAEQARVWVLRDGKPVRVAFTPGLDDDTYTEVVKGEFNPGDQIIVGEQASGNTSGRVAAPRLR